MAAEQVSVVGAGTPSENLSGNGGTAEALPPTALFQHVREIAQDVKLTRAAFNQRWDVPKEMAHAILRSAGEKALEEHCSIPQKVMVLKMFVEMDGKNMSEEHHHDRMEYLERARQDRAKVGEYRQGVNIGVQATGTSNLKITLPHNFRDKIDLDEDYVVILPPPDSSNDE